MNPVSYHIGINDRQFHFQMDFDPDFAADVNLRILFEQGDIPEKEVLSLMFNVLKPGDLAIDAGANVGLFSIFMAQLGCNVFAFEPSVLNFAKLKINAALSGADIRMEPSALSRGEGTLAFYEAADTGQSALQPSNGEAASYVVNIATLDSFGLKPKLIKLDCEGAEENILHGAERTLLLGVPYVVCELADENLERFNSSQFSVREYMRELGYECWLLRADGHLPAFLPYATAIVSDVLNVNVLFATEQTVTETWKAIHIVRS